MRRSPIIGRATAAPSRSPATASQAALTSAARSLYGVRRGLQAAAALDPVAARSNAGRTRDRIVRVRAEVEAIENLLSERNE